MEKETTPFVERFEMKFLIPFSLVEPISQFVAAYCSPDEYSGDLGDGYYRVNNLYLDSPNYFFLRMRLADAESRFNLRVRYYGERPFPPYFLEVKHKVGDVVRKYRSEVNDQKWYKIFEDPGYVSPENCRMPVTRDRALFERLLLTYNAGPQIFTQYLRKVWVSNVDAYARVTFDMALKYKEQTGYEFDPEGELLPCDPETVFDQGCSVILELKCYAAYVPVWMMDMVRYFNLKRGSFSKYATGMLTLLDQFQCGTDHRIPVC